MALLVLSSATGDAKLKLTEAALTDDSEDHQLLLMQKLALASFLPEISQHVRCHVGFSSMISSFCYPLMTVAASVDVECNEENVPHWDCPERRKSS